MAIEVSLRRATQADFDFARDVHHRSMRCYVEPLFGWDKADQTRRFRANFSLDGAWVITYRGQDIGWLQILDCKDRTDVQQIFILPEYQNQGIGTTVLTRLSSKWNERGSSVTLGVFKNNPAHRLYQRLGFRVVGEEEHKYLMRWDREAYETPDGAHVPCLNHGKGSSESQAVLIGAVWKSPHSDPEADLAYQGWRRRRIW